MITPEVLYSLITVLIVVVIGAYAWYRGKKQEVIRMICYFVQVAEDKFGSGTGDIKYAYVIERIYPILPGVLKFFFTEKQLDIWITEAVDKLQENLCCKIEK